MPIRVNCRHCGKSFSAWEDLVGKLVQCPKCKQSMTVPGGNDQLPDLSAPAAAPPAPAMKPAQTSTITAPPAQNATPVPQAMPAKSVGQATSMHAADLDESDELPFACPKCHQPMPSNEDLCDHCGYHRILKRCIDISDGIRKPDKTTGFERVFRGQLQDPDSAQGTMRLLKIVGLFFAAAFLFVCHPWSWLIAAAGVVGFLIWRRKQLARPAVPASGSMINQDLLSAAAWSSVLALQRVIGWRQSQWPFAPTRALTLHDSTFTDTDLDSLENLADFQTLDLERTQLSNAGLRQLASQKQLRYIVVRGTNVSPDGVQRLQQALPRAWIWH